MSSKKVGDFEECYVAIKNLQSIATTSLSKGIKSEGWVKWS
ncbi:MAG: hypothetical protein ACXACP_03565 [Candidatus Hodarchaeales archaeon]